MGAVTEPIVRRFIEVSRGPVSQEALLAGVGLTDSPDASAPTRVVPAETYYDLLERLFDGSDHGLPVRYGEAVRPEDFGAFGLAVKTAGSVREALERLVRYILVVSDTLEYELSDEREGSRLVLRGRPSNERLGIRLANEGAFSAIVSLLRQVAERSVDLAMVSFRHGAPADVAAHRAHFGCEVRFDAGVDALHFSAEALGVPMRLGDEGLSAFLMSQLDALRRSRDEGSFVLRVRRAVTDALCKGPPRKSQIARLLGMSERTLQRHLAEHGRSFQDVVTEVRREVAESLLTTTRSSLSEVAFLTGFSDQSAFQRAFKGWTGQTPYGFRQAVP